MAWPERQRALLCGLLSGLLFISPLYLGGGLPLSLLAHAPLLRLAFTSPFPASLAVASLFAAGGVALSSGVPAALIYAVLIVFPVFYLIKGFRRFALGSILSDLAAVGALISAVVIVWHGGDLQPALAAKLAETLTQTSPNFAPSAEALGYVWSFLMMPLAVWMWVLLFWFSVFLATRGLTFPSPATLHPFALPMQMLSLLVAGALLSLMGEQSVFMGKILLGIFTLPYFLLGLSLLHELSKNWQHRKLWLGLIYIIMVVQAWPIVVLAAWGVWRQCSPLNRADD